LVVASETFGWIGVDLDGTLAHYDRWRGVGHIGQPIMPMVWRVRNWLAEGRDVRIFTARVAPHPQQTLSVDELTAIIQDYTELHLGKRLPVTCQKDYAMIELWDDRAVGVVPNTGEPIGHWDR
jgi:hypothetical protein